MVSLEVGVALLHLV